MLGTSKEIASKKLQYSRQRLERSQTMKNLYLEFLTEYDKLQHIEEVKENSDADEGYYIPHYGVLQPSSKTTKCRIVFNASTKTSTKFSLNDLSYV